MAQIKIGIDEAGRGPLAGPVVAAAVVLEGELLKEVADSKKISAARREKLYPLIKEQAQGWAIAIASAELIDEHNILQATKIAMHSASAALEGDLLLIDGNQNISDKREQQTIIKGDQLEPRISAASILAKVERDRIMKQLGDTFPEYGLEAHSGYPTKLHKERIVEFGPSCIHRKSFRGVKEFEDTLRPIPEGFSIPVYLEVRSSKGKQNFAQQEARRFR